MDRRATWTQALTAVFTPIVLLFAIRWLLLEPYVIPSGSMIPTLLIHDHIFVNKLAYGVHFPFRKEWLVKWNQPQRFDVIVFRYPANPEVFYVKRVIGLPGDRVSVSHGEVLVNGEALPQTDLNLEDAESFHLYREDKHTIRYRDKEDSNYDEITVPEGKLFVMGDNRDQSSDSRVWGEVPLDHVIGRASFIWLSCNDTLATARFLCDPQTIRWSRIFRSVDREE